MRGCDVDRKSMSDPKATVAAFVDAVNRQDWPAVADLTTPDFTRHQNVDPPSVRTRYELIAFLQTEARTFPDAHERINFLVCENDHVAAHLTFRGTQSGPLGAFPASDRSYQADFICIFRVTGGQVAESWVAWDGLHMIERLGLHAPAADHGERTTAELGLEPRAG
jgi:steroid delta-isomerase-like uncharacterized protein